MSDFEDKEEQEDSGLSFPRKYRPLGLAGYIGNEKAKASIMRALSGKSKRPQTMLLSGASGCGKTTFARIIAREYSCENRDPVKGACGECDSCRELENYIHTGNTDMLQYVRELDISKKRSVQDLEEVVSEMDLPTYGGAWRVYIFDECHMASPTMQNALLKVVEEPPENVLIMFCTTDPDKMIDTLRNRCQLKFEIRKPSNADLCNLLQFVAKTEGASYDSKGLSLIANRADYVIRESLIKLEQVLNEKGDAKLASVLDVFEEVSDDILFNFYRLLLNHDSIGFVTLIHKIKSSVSLQTFVRNLEEFTKRGIYVLNNAETEGLTKAELESYKGLFSQFSADKIVYLLGKLLDCKNGDIETKLLLLGYTGLEGTQPNKNLAELFDVTQVQTKDNELDLEQKETSRNKKEAESEELEEGLSKAETLVEPASEEDIMGMFNAVLVEE